MHSSPHSYGSRSSRNGEEIWRCYRDMELENEIPIKNFWVHHRFSIVSQDLWPGNQDQRSTRTPKGSPSRNPGSVRKQKTGDEAWTDRLLRRWKWIIKIRITNDLKRNDSHKSRNVEGYRNVYHQCGRGQNSRRLGDQVCRAILDHRKVNILRLNMINIVPYITMYWFKYQCWEECLL